jgi:hypothetical protein
MSYIQLMFLYLTIGVLPAAPFVFLYITVFKKDIKEIPKYYLVIFFIIMGWLSNRYLGLF